MKAPRSLAGSIGFTPILSEDSGHDEVDRPHHRSRDRPAQEPGMRVDWVKLIPSPENSRAPVPRIVSIGRDRSGVGITPGA